MNYAQIKAIEKKNKERILKVCPEATEESGIYIFTREENGFRFGYVGQAKHILTRLAQHLSGYQHIDLSLKTHGFYSKDNLAGYAISLIYCNIEQLDEMERKYIAKLANDGVQLRNKTSGGQDCGKFGIAPNKPSKGYRDGLQQGYKNAQKEIAPLFEKWLRVDFDETKKLAIKANEKFKNFINLEEL
jgi:hypothetical protein